MSKEIKPLDSKTFKREVASALLAGTGYVVWSGNVEMVNAIIWPVIVFAGGAFGIDAVSKQLRDKPTESTDG